MRLPKALLYIDGQSTHTSTKQLGFDIDYKRLLAHFRKDYTVPRVVYATLVHAVEEFNSLRPLLDWLDFNGFQTLTREKISVTDSNGVVRFQTSIDTALAIDALEYAYLTRPEFFFLFSGDGALAPLIRPLQRLGIHVTVVSTTNRTDKYCDSVLRRFADDFLELADLEPFIGAQRRPRLPDPEPEPEAIAEPLDPRELVDTTPKPVTVERRKVIRRGAGH